MISQKNNLDDMIAKLSRAENRAKTNIINAVDEVVSDEKHGAEALIQGVIMTTPSSLRPGKANRYLTGNMHDKAEGLTVMNNQGLPTVFFGWLKADLGPEDAGSDEGDNYFFLQEFGGVHPLNGKTVSPMNALEKVSRDYLATQGLVAPEGGRWSQGTTVRLIPLVMEALKSAIRGEDYRGSKLS